MPDNDGEGQSQGLAMLRLEARRYKREMQQIWKRREIHEQKKCSFSSSCENPLKFHDDGWRFSNIHSPSSATSGTRISRNREDIINWRFEQLAIVDEGTQTDIPSTSEIQTEIKKNQLDEAVVRTMPESKTDFSESRDLPGQRNCSRYCDELRSRITQEAACECLADASVRVNADVVFTAKPKRVLVGGQMETSDFCFSRARNQDEDGIILSATTHAAISNASFENAQKRTDPVQCSPTGLMSLVYPVTERDPASLPISNLYGCGVSFRGLPTKNRSSNPTKKTSLQQGMPELERAWSFPPPTLSCQISMPKSEASFVDTKAEIETSNFSEETSGSKGVSNELTEEGGMAANLATRIKQALCAISGDADTRSTKSTSSLSGRAMQSVNGCRAIHREESSGMKFSEERDKICVESGASNKKDLLVRNTSSADTCDQFRIVPVISQNLIRSDPPTDADLYFQNVMAALSTDRHAPDKRSGSCGAREMSSAQAVKRTERRAEATRSAHVKSCGGNHDAHQADVIKDSTKIDMPHSKSSHMKEKQMLSNVRKLQQVAETAKRLYTDLVDCAYDELRASTNCGNLVIHKSSSSSGDISNCPRFQSELFAATEITSVNRASSASACDDLRCGKCDVCLPQFVSKNNPRACTQDTAIYTSRGNSPCGFEKPPEEVQADCLDEITIELSDDMATDIKVSQNESTKRPGINVEISTPKELPCQRVCSPRNRDEIVGRQGPASWKDSIEPNTRRSGPVDTIENDFLQSNSSNQLVKKGHNNCLLDPYCVGPRDSCHMPKYRKSSRATAVSFSEPKSDSKECFLDPFRACPRNHVRNDCSRNKAAIISNNRSKKGLNLCLLNHCCVGHRNSCHSSAYEKTSRSVNRPGGNPRNNGTHLGDEDLSCLRPRGLVHHGKEIVSAREKSENNRCSGKQHNNRRDDKNNPHNEISGDVVMIEGRNKKGSKKSCWGVSEISQGRLKKTSKVRPPREDRNHRDLSTTSDVRSSLSKVEGNETTNGDHDETSPLNRPSNEKTDLNDPVKIVHKPYQDCSRTRMSEGTQFKFPATEIFSGEHALVVNETEQSPVGHTIDDGMITPQQKSQPDATDRAVAAAGFAKEIELMIAEQLDRSSRRIIESSHSMSRHKLLEDQTVTCPQTNLDRVVSAAANAVNKCMLISFPLVKQDELKQKQAPRKGSAPRATLISEDANGDSFYDQLDQQLKVLASQRMKLIRQERTHFQSLFGCLQERDPEAKFYMKGRSSAALKILASADNDIEESKRSIWMQKSNDHSITGEKLIGYHISGSKRQRSFTFPTRKNGKKLLRLSVGKSETQFGKKIQHRQATLPSSLNQAATYSNKGFDSVQSVKFEPIISRFSGRKSISISESVDGKLSGTSGPNFDVSSLSRLSSSSFVKWKPLPEQPQAKSKTQRRICNTWKIRSSPWVERMAKAKESFSSLIHPMLLAHSRKERQLKATVYRRSFPPPGLMFRSSIGSSSFRKHIPADRDFSRVQQNPSRLWKKHPSPSIQYDINTGRKIVGSELEPGELTRAKNNHTTGNFKSHASCIYSAAALDSRESTIRVNGWNSDPLIKTDIPHKPTDIMRYNRNIGRVVQVRRGDTHSIHKTSPGTSRRPMSGRRVTFAGMVVHNPRNTKSHKDSSTQGNVAPKSLEAERKAFTSPHGKVSSAVGKHRNFSRTKSPSMRNRGKAHRYGNGGKLAQQNGFWTELVSCELDKVSENDLVQDMMSFGSISQPESSILKLEIPQGIDPLGKLGNRAGTESLSMMDNTVLDGGDVTVLNNENIPWLVNASSSATITETRNNADVKENDRFDENWNSRNPDLLKSLSFFKSHGLEGSSINNLMGVAATSDFLCDTESSEDEQSESCSEHNLSTHAKKKTQDYLERPESNQRDIRSKNIALSPFSLPGGVFSESSENGMTGCMIDDLHESTCVEQEIRTDERCPALEHITGQTFTNELADETEGHIQKIELEQTLTNIALHRILQDHLLQDREVFASSIQPISLPINRKMINQGDKEVEVPVQSHEINRYPTPEAVVCLYRAEHDAVPHVEIGTEQEIVSSTDKGTISESSLFFKDLGTQVAIVEPLVDNILRSTPPAHRTYSTKTTQVHHEEIEHQSPRQNVGLQTPGKNEATTTASPNPSAAMAMLTPVLRQQLGTSILPTKRPIVHFELPIHVTSSQIVHPPPLSLATCSFPAEVSAEIQDTRDNIQLNFEVTAAPQHPKLSKSSRIGETVPKHLRAEEEASEEESDWEDLKGSSPSTPSTPLSSPGYRMSLKNAMELYPGDLNVQATVRARQDIQQSVSEVFQLSANNIIQPDQNLERKSEPPIQIMTEMVSDYVTTEEQPQTSAGATRRFTSWSKVKEMEKVALVLIGAATMKMVPVISSSEYSPESSPAFHSLSPGEMNIEDDASDTNGRFLNSSCISNPHQDHMESERQVYPWASLDCGRASVGEINYPQRFFGSLSEGEVEAGILTSSIELGEIHRSNYSSQHRADLQGCESGELDADDYSPR